MAPRPGPLRGARGRRPRLGRPHHLHAHRLDPRRRRGARGGARLIAATYGAAALPEKANLYRSKKGAQDAHEAIRPTSFDLPPEAVRDFLKPDEWKLYKLIWDRFVASQMQPAVFDVTQVDVENGPYVLRATGRVLREPGFLAVYREAAEEDAPRRRTRGAPRGPLPPVAEGEELKLLQVSSEQKFTQPPAAVQRGDPGQGAGGERHRPALDLRHASSRR